MNKLELKELLNNKENWLIFEELEHMPTADLWNAKLEYANLKNANLKNAKLEYANLEYANFGKRKLIEKKDGDK